MPVSCSNCYHIYRCIVIYMSWHTRMQTCVSNLQRDSHMLSRTLSSHALSHTLLSTSMSTSRGKCTCTRTLVCRPHAMCCGGQCVVEVNVLWKSMCCGGQCVVEVNVLWKSMCCGSQCVVEVNVLWKSETKKVMRCVDENSNQLTKLDNIWNDELYDI